MPDSPARRSPAQLVLLSLAAAALAALVGRSLAISFAYLPNPGDCDYFFRAARYLASGRSPYLEHNFDYPPLLAFLLVRIVARDWATARVAWWAVNALSVLGAGLITWRHHGGGLRAALIVGTLWGCFGYVAQNLGLGQPNPLLLLLVTGCLALYPRNRGTAGALLGIAAALKLWPALLLVVPAFRHRRRALALGMATLVLGIGGPLLALRLLVPPPWLSASSGFLLGTPALYSASLPSLALRLVEPPVDHGPLPERWLLGNDPGALVLPAWEARLSVAVAAATLLAGTAAVLWRLRRATQGYEDEVLALGALLVVAVLASPISWYHYQIFLLPPAALLAARWLVRRQFGRLFTLAILLASACWNHPWSLGAYSSHFGWTAAAPARLWLALALVPASDLVVLGLLLAEIGAPSAAAVGAGGEVAQTSAVGDP